MIKEIYKGESVSFLLTFEQTYDMARIQSHYIYIGNVPFIGEISGHTISLQLKSNETNELYGPMKVVLCLDDSLLGVRKPFLFDLNVVRTKAEPSNVSTSEINDVIVPIVISETEITVDDILYNYVKGDKGDSFTFADFTPEQITELQAPALEAKEIVLETNENVTIAEGLRADSESARVTAEGLRVTNESSRVTVEGGRVTAEQDRVNAENIRVNAESTRGSNEITRNGNENTRISQEAARVAAEAARVAAGSEVKTNKQNSLITDGTGVKYPTVDAVVDNFNAVSKNGGQSFNVVDKIKPTGQVWSASTSYTDKWLAVWYKGISTKTINRISIPIVKNFVDGLNFTDGLTVKVFLNSVLKLTKIIPFSDVSPFNALTTSSPIDSFFYNIDVLPFTLNAGDTLFIGVECNAVSDKISMIYTMNGTPSDTSEWTRNYTASGENANYIINLTSQPTTPASQAFYRAIRCSYVDYIGKQIDDKISGSSSRTDLTIMPPKKIYNVFNDLKGVGEDDLYAVRFHASTLFFDHLVNGITEDLDVDFAETGNEKINFFAPEMTTNVSTVTKTIAYNNGAKYNGGSFSVIQKNVKESVGASKFPKILTIGDSVTTGYLSNIGNKTGLPNQYWAVIKEQFEQSRIDASDNSSLHNCLLLGHKSSCIWNMTYGTATNRQLKAYAEGYAGWGSSTHMYWSRNWGVRGQGLWDLLGLGNGTGTDFTNSAAQQLSMFTTPEGYLAPKNTAAFLAYINSELTLSLTTYSDAVNALNAKEADPENPFYSKTTAAGGVIAFSMLTYLNRYKTLNNDGTTRLVVGSTAGTKVTDVNAYDVCLPTHLIIQHSHNDGDVIWFADNMKKWTDAIKAEYSANGWTAPFIGISVIRHTGTFYPKRYPMFDRASITLWTSNQNTGYNNTQKIINKFWVSDANEDSEKVYILPSMHVQPPAWGIPFRSVNTPEFDITGYTQHLFRVLDGAGATYHPNSIAHRCWGMQMYAWVRWTLSL